MIRNTQKLGQKLMQKSQTRAFSFCVAPRRARGRQTAQLASWDPFNDPFFSDPVFNNAFKTLNEIAPRFDVRIPDVDISRTDSGLRIEANVPGWRKEEISVHVDGRWLTISGERESKDSKEDTEFHVRERHTGSFSRQFHLPEDAKPQDVQAKLVDGVLVLEIPVEKVPEKKKIEIV